MAGRGARRCREVPDFGGQHEVIPAGLAHQMTDKPLGAAVPVDVGGVEQVRAELAGGLQALRRGPVVGGGPSHRQAEIAVRAADGPASDANRVHGQSAGKGPPRRSLAHRVSLSSYS